MTGTYLYFDLETHNAGRQYSMSAREFVRTFQYAWDDGPVQVTTDYDEMLAITRSAKFLVAHNGLFFDTSVLFGTDSVEPLRMAMDKRVIDTFVLASLVTPAPNRYTDEKGHTFFDADKPGTAMRWLSLANLCYQFGLPGKFGDLSEIAKKYNPEKTKKADLDYGLIPIDDEDFQYYMRQDVIAVRALYQFLLTRVNLTGYPGDYIWREMELAAAMAQLSRNGLSIDQDFANDRIANMATDREEIMAWLVETYDFPTEGKSPWGSTAGKQVILDTMASFGITPETHDWPKTPTGAPKLGGDDLMALTDGQGEEAERFGQALATLKSQRSIPQLVLDSTHPDGKVHMDVSSLQRSGRWSFQRPGITVVGSREGKDADKALFVAENGRVLAGFDYSNADPRAMAALSGDREYAKRFLEVDPETGKDYDGHNLTGEALFGKEAYYVQMKNGKPILRPVSKAAGNAMNYNVGAKKLTVTLNTVLAKEKIDLPPFSEGDAKEMNRNFHDTYAALKKFKDRAVKEGEQNGFVVNSWGRKMTVDRDRAYTQAPALYGQGSVREMMGDAILRLIRRGEYYARSLRAIIHDELLLEFDEDTIERDVSVVKECMEATFHPKGGIAIAFPVGFGYGRSWKDAGH